MTTPGLVITHDAARDRDVCTLDGIEVPGISRILRAAGLKPDYDRVHPDILERARVRGVMVHEACDLLDQDDLDWDDLDPVLVPYVRAWERFTKETGFTVVWSEFVIADVTVPYWGRADVCGTFPDKTLAYIERKATAKVDRTYGVQLAAQVVGTPHDRQGRPLPPNGAHPPTTQRLVVQLKPDAKYRRVVFDDPDDFGAWDAAVHAYQAGLLLAAWQAKDPKRAATAA